MKKKSPRLASFAAAAGAVALVWDLSSNPEKVVKAGQMARDTALGAAYYTVVPLVGAAAKIAGADPLRRRIARADSYWIPRSYTKQTNRQFERTS